MTNCNDCLYSKDGICQNDECSFDLEDNCCEFESRQTYDKGYQQGKADQKKKDNEFFNFDKVIEIEKNESYQQGAREFAEWLANGCAFMRRLGEDDMHTVDEVLAEWQKGARDE